MNTIPTFDPSKVKLYNVSGLASVRGREVSPQLIFAPSSAMAKVMAAARADTTWNEDTLAEDVPGEIDLRSIVPEHFIISASDYVPPQGVPVAIEYLDGSNNWTWTVGWHEDDRYWRMRSNANSRVRRWHFLPLIDRSTWNGGRL